MAIIRGWKLLFLKFFLKHHCSLGVEVACLAAEVVWSVSSCTGWPFCAQGKSGLTVSYLQGRACHHMSPNCCGCHFLERASAGLTVAKATEDLHAAPSSTGDAQSWRPVVGLVEVAALKGVTYEPGHTTQGAGTLRPLCSSLVPPPPGSAFPDSSWQGWASAVSNWSRCWARRGLHCARHCLLSLSRTATRRDASVQALTPVTWRAKSSGDQWLNRGQATASVTLLSAWGQLAQVLQPCVYWWRHLDKITWSNS